MANSKNPFALSMVRVRGPEGCGNQISVRGFTIERDEDGTWTVPSEVADELCGSHGFSIDHTPPPAPKPAPAPAPK